MRIITATLAALALAGLAACGSSGSSSPAGQAASPSSCAAAARHADPRLTPAQVDAICGSAASNSPAVQPVQPPPPPTSVAVPANPVTIIKMADATTKAVYGTSDLGGGLSADGILPGTTVPHCGSTYADDNSCRESVEVWTFTSQQDQAEAESNAQTSDDDTLITGYLFEMILYPVQLSDDQTWVYPVKPDVIAARVHGAVIPPPS